MGSHTHDIFHDFHRLFKHRTVHLLQDHSFFISILFHHMKQVCVIDMSVSIYTLKYRCSRELKPGQHFLKLFFCYTHLMTS